MQQFIEALTRIAQIVAILAASMAIGFGALAVILALTTRGEKPTVSTPIAESEYDRMLREDMENFERRKI